MTLSVDDMWRILGLLALNALLSYGVRSLPAADLNLDRVLSELDALPEDAASPEVVDLYQDVELLWKMYESNLTDSREGRGLLSKLSFLTGLKLGGFLSSSGTLAASQSVNFLGKVLNAALSVSYGDTGGIYGGIRPGVVGGLPVSSETVVTDTSSGETSVIGLQKLPVIQEDVPEDKKDQPVVLDLMRKEFLKLHNQRVEEFNNSFEKKVRGRTGRTEPKSRRIA